LHETTAVNDYDINYGIENQAYFQDGKEEVERN